MFSKASAQTLVGRKANQARMRKARLTMQFVTRLRPKMSESCPIGWETTSGGEKTDYRL